MPRGSQRRAPIVRKTRRRRPKRVAPRSKWPLWLALAVVVAVTAYIVDGLRTPSSPEAQSGAQATSTAGGGSLKPPVSNPERYDLPDVARQEPPAAEGTVQPVVGRARLALVIDDLGRDVADVDRIAGLGVPVTYAVLPFEARTPEVRDRIVSGGHEVICHLPMEPTNGANPGPGALTSGMRRRELANATRRALAAVPGAVGVNNHMGSSLTADRQAMEAILRVIANRGLYFLDSRTSADSVGFAMAREMRIPTIERKVFLDGELTREWVAGQFRRALSIAAEDGSAVVIGHPHDVTLTTLESLIPEAQRAGYEFVEVSALLERAGSAGG